MPSKIYIDLGANRGDTVERFISHNPGFVTFAFEPTPSLAEILRRRFSDPSQNVRVMEFAAWIHDGSLTFYIGKQSDQSSTILQNKKSYPGWEVDYQKSISVRSLDFDLWFRNNTSADDFVMLKMDIEGGEYKLLPRLLQSGSLSRVKKLAVEWHADRFPMEVTMEDHHRIRDQVRSVTDLVDWK